jgi:uncharacterized membrane protein YoaT (DUF817 family)
MYLTKHRFLNKIQQLPGGRLWAFGIRQAWAALFGGLLLTAIIFHLHLLHLQNDWLDRA